MLKQIFKENKLAIIVSYLVLIAENGIFALYPWMFGRAVDGMLNKDNSQFKLYMVLMTVGILIGSFRRVVDTRIFGKIWCKFSTDIIVRLLKKETDKNKTMVCAGISPSYVDFIEWQLPHGVRAGINIVTALVMLWIALPGPGTWMVIIAIGVMVAADYVAKKQAYWKAKKLDACEESTKAINDRDCELLTRSYADRIRCYIKGSDWEAAGWCVSDALSMVAEAIIVLALVKTGATLGVILATSVYVGTLFNGMNTMAFFVACLRGLAVCDAKIKSALEEEPAKEDTSVSS